MWTTPFCALAHREGYCRRTPLSSRGGVVTLADRPGMILELVVLGRGSLVSSALPSYKGHRHPVEVIAHCVWLHFRLPLSFREVEELMLERGVLVSHETVRRWCAKFGQAHSNDLRRPGPRPGDKGIWTRSSSRSTESRSTSVGPSTPTATCSASSCRTAGTQPQPGVSSAAL